MSQVLTVLFAKFGCSSYVLSLMRFEPAIFYFFNEFESFSLSPNFTDLLLPPLAILGIRLSEGNLYYQLDFV